ncbi:alpha/beta hydrolase [Paraburkholderia domus]|jgi:Esterase/lipase|uniref:Alpha/beta hydrolase fold-3 domain-containing protein n=1 Tax=Paraburkholderia domus TaxID=2793075 RepID=A0A9N8QZK5_9BURK|nr:alpha/beta fold hydrolase [Paraburkholderia domus]MBK5049994.1 alpha/beta fold hydrolase [Burkholderia sp. R-70006]MBK5063030.1 alpha/beta fold hydrolase [Burkholderia sp. R-70199]MBK5121451.1 alpha/beta fold hydrolase [Burkholderia sp. R-69980]MBK5166595.1 alpha/beta fold hydrolase [Burkholderia sp. R-70211]MBK5182469.1 alpha/beta fold hydrolase [Burkholderia sp. R-69749]
MHTLQEPLGSLSATLRQRFAQIGPVWGRDINKHRDLVIDAYSPLVAAARDAGESFEAARDIAYGGHERQRLDVFASVETREKGNADVVLFVHGGAFLRGSKSFNGLIYDNVSRWFARQGLVALNVEYRLAPDAPYPAGADDVAAALAWAQKHAAEFGGNPQRIFLVGHSAGGAHVATYLCDPLFAGLRDSASAVAGAVLISARLAADVLPDNPNAAGVRAYFGADETRYAARSPLTHAAHFDTPLMVVVAEYENPYLDAYGAAFFERVLQARQRAGDAAPKRAPRFMQMLRHNHTSVVAHFDSGETLLGDAMLDFFSA